MASQGNRSEPRRATPRLYLVTPRVGDPAALTDALAGALAAAEVAAVLLRLADADERALTNRIKALAQVVQARGAALLVDGHTELVGRAGADGAHLTGIDDFTAALATLKPERIAGCGGLYTRHEAMTAA
jgi:thiamine-phosphate pyrophosphorylase